MLYLEDHPYLAPFDGSFDQAQWPTGKPEGAPGKKQLKERLEDIAEDLDEQQRMLYAHDRYAVLLVFQALDAAGKDGTIRAVFHRVDPKGATELRPAQSSSSGSNSPGLAQMLSTGVLTARGLP